MKKYGLTCAMGNGAGMGIEKAFNQVKYHDSLVGSYETLIRKAAAAGINNNIICTSGNRFDMDDERGLLNCEKGLKRLMPLAEEMKVNVCMENLNNYDHKDYQFDHMAWGVELCRRVGSERFKLLYDICHAQIMEGNLIDTIQKNIQYIAHFHVAGVPGRDEYYESQVINFPAVMTAIVKTGFKGFVAQEFMPKHPL